MKLLFALILALMIMLPAHSAEPLQGGVDYTETIPSLEAENGTEQHGQRVIEWNAWVDRFEKQVLILANKIQERTGVWNGINKYAIYTVLVRDDGTLAVRTG